MFHAEKTPLFDATYRVVPAPLIPRKEGPSAVVEPALVCTENVLSIVPLGNAIRVTEVPPDVT